MILLDHDKDNFKRPLQNMSNYEDLKLSKETRTNSDTCNCYICLTGRFTGHSKVQKGKGNVQSVSNC